MDNITQTQLIEDYLDGLLHQEKRQEFEMQLAQNPLLKKALAQHIKLRENLQMRRQHRQLKAMLNSFHDEIDTEKDIQPILKNYRRKPQLLLRKYFPTIAVAASVALITVFSTLFTTDYLKSLEKTQANNYRYLKREVDQLKITQKVLKNSLDTAVMQSPYNRNQHLKFGGTSFVLNSEGYLLTSNHLVFKSDSIFIESIEQPGLSLRVQLVHTDSASDLAILKVVDSNFRGFGKPPYTFRNDIAELGEEVFTLAYPREDLVYGEGSISARSGFEGNIAAYQVSIPVNPGNSGGPVFDGRGNVVGVISGKLTGAEGVAFAMKSTSLLKAIQELPVADSLPQIGTLPKANRLAGIKRTSQLRKIQEFVFQVRVY